MLELSAVILSFIYMAVRIVLGMKRARIRNTN